MNGLINHIEIYVENLEETREFYEWLLTKLGYKLFNFFNIGKRSLVLNLIKCI